MAWGGRQRAMETAQHWDRLAKNQPAEIAMFQISEVQESPAFNLTVGGVFWPYGLEFIQ
jgi:hypothetical protein